MDYTKYFNDIDEKLALRPDNIDKVIYEAPNIQNELIKQYIKEKTKLIKLELKYNKIYGEKYHYYRHEFDFKCENKDVANLYVKKDEEYIKAFEEYEKQKLLLEMFDKYLKRASQIGFDLKNIIDYLKFMNGEH